MQAEKWVLRAVRAAGAGLTPASRVPAALPATKRGAAGAATRALHAVGRAAWRAARVVMVYAWLWGLADFTFWKSTQACALEAATIPEIAAAVDAVRAGALRAAAALQLGALAP
jgi:hypothetical protein